MTGADSTDRTGPSDAGVSASGRFLVFARAPAALRLEWDQPLRVNFDDGARRALVATERIAIVEQDARPGDILVRVEGRAAGLTPSAGSLLQGVPAQLDVLALAANAAVGQLQPLAVYGITPRMSRRQFLQARLQEQPLMRNRRPLETGAAAAVSRAFLASVTRLPDRKGELLGRAAAQYNLALRSWQAFSDIRCMAHLFMAAEALARFIELDEPARLGVRREEWAKQFFRDAETMPMNAEKLSRELVWRIRRDIVFAGDEACHNAARVASDGFEHGYLPLDGVHELWRPHRDATAAHVRTALLRAAGLKEDWLQQLTDTPYDRPAGLAPEILYICGELVGMREPPEWTAFPRSVLSVDHTSVGCKPGQAGGFELTTGLTVVARDLPPGVTVESLRAEVWRP